jgi:hypothetical protein
MFDADDGENGSIAREFVNMEKTLRTIRLG